MAHFAVMSDGHYYSGYEADSVEDALFAHVPYGGRPEATTEPLVDRWGFWHKGTLLVYAIHNEALAQIVEAENISDLECEGEGDFVRGTDFEWIGNYRWIHEPD